MKIAVVYNRGTGNVINLFGMPNREKIALKTIGRLVSALKAGGHQVVAIEGDKDLVAGLEEFMPRVVKGERPGLVFNVSYGVQGQARYTHVPSILEMVGIPYVASGPLAHTLCLDKVVTKMILRQHGLPTPDFAVLHTPDAEVSDLTYPLIVKPKNEAVSFGLKVVDDEAEMRAAAKVIFDEFRQPVLVEQFIAGREVNVGLLGNDPPDAFPPVELVFGEEGPAIYTYEDKTGQSGRSISHACPAPLGDALTAEAQELARRAFIAVGCYDCARVDMRLDGEGKLYILEINSLPSLGEHGSYLVGAEHVGLDFSKFINRLVEVASARYYSTPSPPTLAPSASDPSAHASMFITARRDRMERRLADWVRLQSRTADPLGLQKGFKELSTLFEDLGLREVPELSDEGVVTTWQTKAGLNDGVLLIGNLDVPVEHQFPAQAFRRDPEWLHGEGIATSRAPLVMMEYALRALRSLRRLRQIPLGVLYYADEGQDARYSADEIRAAAVRAREVLVLQPGLDPDKVVLQRRGQRTFRLEVETESMWLGRAFRKPDALRWTWRKLEEITEISSQADRIAVATTGLRTERNPLHLPHRVTADIVETFPSTATGDTVARKMRAILGKGGPRYELVTGTTRPPFVERPAGRRLAGELARVASNLDFSLERGSSAGPSVAGLVPADKACVCALGPVARGLRTPQEAVKRITLVQRSLLLAEFLASRLPDKESR
ncbi:MAG: ATP-grasp domain-containing protein [Acidobacteria bacterium]|nr:ATP-grasp domain-containing protein [Acidobacteriota bacterium]